MHSQELSALKVGPAARVAAVIPSAAAPDFTARLPAEAFASAALPIVQDAAQRSGVSVASVHVQESASTTERLGRAELSVAARGSYAGLKRWLAEVSGRLPAATVSRLQMQRIEGSPEVEARVVLLVWSQAAAATPPARP